MKAEPKELKNSPALGDICLNCGTSVDSKYCPECGQHNTSHNHGLWQFIQEFLEEFIRFDSKLIRTLWPLVRRPGFLTQEWVAGKRVRYITPLRLYVTLSAVCFLAISIKSHYVMGGQSDFKVNLNQPKVSTPTKVKVSPEDSAFESLLKRKLGSPSQADGKELSEKFMSLIPTTNFILMPIFAGIFQLLYIRRKRFYVEHLVFVLHYYSFAFLVTTFTSLLPIKLLSVFGVLWVMGYLPVAMVRNYGQGWLKTLLKVGIFGFLYAIVLAIAVLATLLVTAVMLPDKTPPTSEKPAISNPSSSRA